MAIGVTLNAAFNVNDTIYTADMSLPTAALSATAPFQFSITSQAATGDAPPITTLVSVAVGGSNLVYVAVAPPADLINDAANLPGLVKTLEIVVQEGGFVPPAAPANPPAPPAPTAPTRR